MIIILLFYNSLKKNILINLSYFELKILGHDFIYCFGLVNKEVVGKRKWELGSDEWIIVQVLDVLKSKSNTLQGNQDFSSYPTKSS